MWIWVPNLGIQGGVIHGSWVVVLALGASWGQDGPETRFWKDFGPSLVDVSFFVDYSKIVCGFSLTCWSGWSLVNIWMFLLV